MKSQYSTKELAAAFPAIFSESILKKSRMSNSTVDGPPWKNRGAKVFYEHEAVIAWIAALPQCGAANVVALSHRTPKLPPPPSAKGRPTKEQQIARRNRAA